MAEKARKDKTAEEHIERLEARKAERSIFEAHWQELADYIVPAKNDITTTRMKGSKKGIDLFDSTAPMSCELLAGALHGMLTNPASQWFGLSMGDRALDELDSVRLWLEDCADKMHTVINGSNFQTEVHELYIDELWAGTAGMFIDEHDEKIVSFSTKHISGLYLDENEKGEIDTVDYVSKMTPRQLILAYGEKAVGDKVLKAFKDKKMEPFEVLHSVYPRDMTNPEITADKTYRGYPFGSCHTLICEKRELKEGGYHEMPWVTPRWKVIAGEVYGRSPGMTVLPDIKMVNEMAKTILEGAQKVVNPPVALPDDGFVLPLKLKANGINYRRSGNPEDKITPIFNDTRIDFGYQALGDRRSVIREGFYVDQLRLPTNGPQMTATETTVRQEDKLRIMGPMLGRQQVEFLEPVIARVFGIMYRKKLFKPMPPELRNMKNVYPKYTSSIARAQKIGEGQNIIRGLQTLGPIQAIHPEIMDNFDQDAITRFVAMDVFGFPQRIIRTEKSRNELRQGRLDAQAQQAQQAQLQQQAELAKSGSEAVLNVAQANKAGTAIGTPQQ